MNVVAADFTRVRTQAHLREVIEQFHRDPPDTAYQVGYLDGLVDIYRALFGDEDGVVRLAGMIPRETAAA